MADENWTPYNGTNTLDLLSERGRSQINKLPVYEGEIFSQTSRKAHFRYCSELTQGRWRGQQGQTLVERIEVLGHPGAEQRGQTHAGF